MKVVSLILVCLIQLSQLTLLAQSENVDSLLQILPSLPSDTTKVIVLNKVSKHYSRLSPVKAREYAEEALQLARKLNYKEGVALAYNQLGGTYYYQNNYSNALAWHTRALNLHRSLGNLRGERYTLNDIGLIYHKQNNFPKTLECYFQSLKISEHEGDEKLIASSLNNIADVYTDQENYESALKYYYKALEIRKRIFKQGRKVSQPLLNIGNVYLRQQQYEKAITYYKSSIEGLTEQDNDIKAVALTSLGMAYGGVKEGGLGDFKKALKYLTEALALEEKVGDQYSMPYILTAFAYTYHHLNNLDESEKYAIHALELSKKYEIKSLEAELNLLNSQLAERKGKYTKAYNYHKHYVENLESINNEKNIRRIAELQANYEVEKKQSEIELLKKDKAHEALLKKTLVGGLLVFIIIAGLIVSIQRLKIRKNKLLLQRSKEIEDKNNELQTQAGVLEQQAEELELQTEKLKQLDQLKTNFFTNISHEFRTPLTIIMGALGEKLSAFKDSLQQESLPITKNEVTMMYRNSMRLLQLINQLLDLAKLESGQMKLFLKKGDFIQFTKVILASFESLAQSKNIAFVSKLPPHPLSFYFDADKVETILYNLLSNAFKFTFEGGLVSFEISVDATHRLVKIRISDTGSGIPEKELDKIFERFYQVDGSIQREFEGSGIGLSLTKELVALLGGTIDVESKVGSGTTFTVALPATEKSGSIELDEVESTYVEMASLTETLIVEENRADLQEKHSPVNSILLVDDSNDLRAYISSLLDKTYRVFQASNGVEALELAKEVVPDLILSDMMMPKMDGFTLCQEIRKCELTSHIPFVLLTARASIESRLEGLELGADEYLTKPFNLKELEIRIKNLLEQRKNLREKFSKELKIQPRDVTVTSTDEKFLTRAMEIVEKNIANTALTVEMLSEELGMSRKNLHRKMVALVDQGPNEFIRNFRLKRAKQLIEQNGGNISEIAYGNGFNNLSYFTKCFKEQFGCSPSELRSTNKILEVK